MKLGRRPRFAGRGRERSWWLLLAAALAVVLWAIAQVLGWPIWARAVLAGLAAAVAVIVPELRARFGQDDTRARLVDQRVAVSGGRRRLLRVRDVGLDQLRVHAARVPVPYIERDQQGKLEEAVGPGRPALVVGHSMSGKTRLAAEVVKRKFPDALLVAAESGKALRELFVGGLDPAGVVVWLDDLERFLGADGLSVGLLNRLTAGRAIVVATIRIEQRETYRPRAALWPPEWDVLQRFSEISLQRRLTGPELGRVRAMVEDPGVLAAVDHYGLAEYLGAGPEALGKFRDGEIANPVGHALVRAAVDLRRTGLTRPVSRQVLATMLPTYLADRPDVPRTNQAIDDGLVWATAKINETVALLAEVFTGSNGSVLEAFDYLIDQLTHTSVPVPDPMWALALKQAKSDEFIVIGLAAYQADKPAMLEAAWRQGVDEDDTGKVYRGIVNFVRMLQKVVNLEGARAVYHQAIDSGDAEAASTAVFNLGRLLEGQDALEEARLFYLDVIDSGDADLAPRAAVNFSRLRQGDLEEANFSRLREGDLEEARLFYHQVIDSGHAEWVPIAAVNLERLLKGTQPPTAS